MKKTTNSKIFSNYILVIISITVVLFFLSSFLITILNSEKIINDFKEKIPVVVFLKENISTIELTQFEKKLKIDEKVYQSESNTGHRNRAIGWMLRNFDIIENDPVGILENYFKQCSFF